MDQALRTRHLAALREIVGDVDVEGVETLRLVRIIANVCDCAEDEFLRPAGLSGPRLRLLFRVWGEESSGSQGWASPTHLSRFENVSKNTISTLLRGLEEQGLIERTLDPDDRRAFRIQLTEAGRQLVESMAPRHLAFLNQLVVDLTPAERAQLVELLGKLHRSLIAHSSLAGTSCPGR